ncbi:hypothetical protein PMZ80_004183 [Knufia obscura]|uniref:NAD(P)-binding protein n=1 Tax=Knufia obscura TaxID=1635080 RepID=A0ABR0RS13_9EURO|nr:hypothetical protein PMZ80_004183 [Knufia obscura]
MPTAPTWLITGTSSGFGLSLAQHVLHSHHNLISISRHAAPHDSLTELANTNDLTLHHLTIDLSSPTETTITSAISTFLTKHPDVSIDILINNAAICAFGPLETLPTSTIERCMTVNFYSPLWLIQACLPHMRTSANGLAKVIVNISSTQGLTCDAAEVAYESSKHALEGMSGVLAKEVAPFGIRTVVVNLGSFRTSFALGDSATSGSVDEEFLRGGEDGDPYQDGSHPVKKRIEGCLAFANMPGAARGDPDKGAGVVFGAVMRTGGSKADEALKRQREAIVNGEMGGVSGVERLILGSDALPKIENASGWFGMQVESCGVVSCEADADGVKPLPGR